MNPYVEAAVLRLAKMEGTPLPEYRDAITQELCALTQSEISYFAAVDPSEETLTMIGWSVSAMNICSVQRKPIVYLLEDTGLWGDAIRERKPVITNDYPKLVKPTKRGYPEGHVKVLRHMNLPIFENNSIVLVVGVGNKRDPYTLDDADLVEELMTEAWFSFQRTLWEATW